MEMMVPATKVDPTNMAVQLELAQKPVCSQNKPIYDTLCLPRDAHTMSYRHTRCHGVYHILKACSRQLAVRWTVAPICRILC